jgi:hypothetical protein
MSETKSDIYTRITNRIVADLEQGVRPWHRPWNAEHAAGKITRPLRHNGIPYNGINVVMLWSASVVNSYACPLWLTFKQALELGGNVKKGERGELVVYADRITRCETDDKGEETERSIPFLKGYTVFNAEQCEGLPAQYYAKAEAPALPLVQRIEEADTFFAATGVDIRHGAPAPTTPRGRTMCRCRPSRRSGTPRATPPRSGMSLFIPPNTRSAWRAIWGASNGATKAMQERNSLPSWVRLSSAPTSTSPRKLGPTMPPILRLGLRC